MTYFIAMIFCGIPIFFQEVAIGQYLGSSGMTLVGKLCPILSGEIILIYHESIEINRYLPVTMLIVLSQVQGTRR